MEPKQEERVLEPIQNQLVKIIRRRREQARQLESVFLYSEIIWDDDSAFVPEKKPKHKKERDEAIENCQPSVSAVVQQPEEPKIIKPKEEPKSPEPVETEKAKQEA